MCKPLHKRTKQPDCGGSGWDKKKRKSTPAQFESRTDSQNVVEAEEEAGNMEVGVVAGDMVVVVTVAEVLLLKNLDTTVVVETTVVGVMVVAVVIVAVVVAVTAEAEESKVGEVKRAATEAPEEAPRAVVARKAVTEEATKVDMVEGKRLEKEVNQVGAGMVEGKCPEVAKGVTVEAPRSAVERKVVTVEGKRLEKEVNQAGVGMVEGKRLEKEEEANQAGVGMVEERRLKKEVNQAGVGMVEGKRLKREVNQAGVVTKAAVAEERSTANGTSWAVRPCSQSPTLTNCIVPEISTQCKLFPLLLV